MVYITVGYIGQVGRKEWELEVLEGGGNTDTRSIGGGGRKTLYGEVYYDR